ncbi:protein spire homolog 1 isoform X2 [Electrophorus electricus]|uniref:protein spire homolog 1 isoform X2 n=1 Tax=Electrophorus electricus TaxID=8005 RepID=UPI0015D04241|nr:protein spire homolog 1 isoform X2 [Electrophorus electricus]
MERNGSAPGACQISLSDILALQGRPACEEEAWALCYQLCSLLEPGSWKTLRVPGPDGVLFSSDGRVTLRTDGGETGEQFVIETEDQTVDYVGRLVYSCLDWGLGADVERELNETLELLVCQMTKVNISLGAEHCLQPVCSISEVLQVCEERLYKPSHAAQHYQQVCAMLYSHTVELCHCLQIIQQTREEFAWKNLVEEFSRGVVLRPLKASLSTSARPPADRSPFNQLLQDIQRRRYSLRKVPAVGHGQRRVDPHQALLEVIRSGPKLRPVSERSLKPRTQNPEQETSLHELLMREIRSVDPVKLLSSHKRRQSCKVHSCSHVNSLMTICEDSTNEEASFILNPVPHPSHQGVPAQGGECKGVIPQQDSFTGSADGYLKFFPALSSTPQNPSLGCRLSHRKRRARSFASCRDLCQLAPKSRACVPMTIADVINMHYAKEGKLKTMACEVNWRVCSCCKKKSVYFTWHMVCSLCSRIVCPECCVEMRLPFKWCVNLPLSFFKKIVLNKESKRSQRKFWNERWSWDPLWVPLVLESPVPTSAGPHSLAMRGWHSQAVCIGCKGLLLQALDSVLSRYPIRNHQEV